MNRWALADTVKEKYLPIVESFIKELESVDLKSSTELFQKDFSDTELNPCTLCKILEFLGYEQEEQENNGLELDFWITMTKPECKPISVQGCGITFELLLCGM